MINQRSHHVNPVSLLVCSSLNCFYAFLSISSDFFKFFYVYYIDKDYCVFYRYFLWLGLLNLLLQIKLKNFFSEVENR